MIHTSIDKIEDVLKITNLCEKYKVAAKRISDKIIFYESKGLYTHEKYFNYLNQARELMIELQSKSDFIHYNDF